MLIKAIDRFLGFNTKPDKVLKNPSIASTCNNVIINNGNLCNIPYADFRASAPPWQFDDENLVEIYYYTRIVGTPRSVIVLLTTKGKLFYFIASLINPSVEDITNHLNRFIELNISENKALLPRYPHLKADTTNYNAVQTAPVSGNILQVGDWLFFLVQTGNPLNDFTIDPPHPTMFKIRFSNQFFSGVSVDVPFVAAPIGLKQPSEIKLLSNSAGGNLVGTFDFGFSFSYFNGLSGTANADVTTEIESNVTIYNNSTTYSNKIVVFEIFLPLGYTTLKQGFDVIPYLNVYVRSEIQSIYYKITAVDITGYEIKLEGQKAYIEYTFNSAIAANSQNLTHPAPLTSVLPILGAHDVPKLAIHGCFFKGKMYYNCLELPKNTLQISAATPPDQINTGIYANYIEAFEFIGKDTEYITGLIEFLGQLVIFKETETLVLTDDIAIGSVRNLFPDLGCVNITGGHAYNVIENKLYFGDSKGIFAYDGNQVLKISQPIEKDLQKISKVRYGFMRITHDPLHKLVVVSFPKGYKCDVSEVVPTFLFHYDESNEDLFVWTKRDHVSSVLVDKFSNQDQSKQFNILYNTPKGLELIKSVDDDGEEQPQEARSWEWVSSIIDGNAIEKIKHWVSARLNMQQDLDNTLQIKIEFFDGNMKAIGEEAVVSADGIFNNKFRRIGARSKQLIIKLSGTTRKAFRILGLELNGHVSQKR